MLDAAARTSSMIENINGLLKQFLHNRRAFRNSDTLQNDLNLFTLWHNMRVFARGKRQGMSPYQRAGIDVGADDWLSLIGYPRRHSQLISHPFLSLPVCLTGPVNLSSSGKPVHSIVKMSNRFIEPCPRRSASPRRCAWVRNMPSCQHW
jgi:hypothetical protein